MTSRFARCLYLDPKTGTRCGNAATKDGMCAECYAKEAAMIHRIIEKGKQG